MTQTKTFESLKNLSWLFMSGILVKLIGISRESIIAHEVGNTLLFANFNFFKSIVDFLIAFVIGSPIIETILVPLYSNEYKKNSRISFHNIVVLSKKISVKLFLISVVFFSILSGFKEFDKVYVQFSYVFFFAIFISLYFLNSFNFALLKVKGDFKSYSLQLFVNALIGFLLLILLIEYIGILAVLLSSILFIPFSNWYISKGINLKKNLNNQLLNLSLPKNSFSFLLALGHSTFIGFWGKLFLGFATGLDINYYHYAFILIHSFQNLIVVNLTSVILFKLSSDNSQFSLLYLNILTIFLPIVFVCFFYFGGEYMVKMLFEHGKFTNSDSKNVLYFLHYFLMIPFALLCSSQVLLQPLLSNTKEYIEELKDKTVKNISFLLVFFSSFSLLLKIFHFVTDKQILGFFLYGSSIFILIVTYISYKKYSNTQL